MITSICCHVSGHLMDFSVILTLLLALFWSPPNPEGNVDAKYSMLLISANCVCVLFVGKCTAGF